MMSRLRFSLVLLPAVIGTSGFAADKPTDKPLPPSEAAARMTLPEGFQATLFAGEPDVVQPIGFTFDDRGRLWVAECLSYPNWIKDGKEGKDRVIILEDTDGDGRFDKRKVFHDKLANVSGIEVGFGGVWLCATPNLLFVPDRNGDDVPDGPPEAAIDGWSLDAKHNVFNALRWGPDGWLYGCNGITATSKLGKPGTLDKDRIALNCGVWRYHPVQKEFEPVAWGTTNPWGLDFDDYGQMFITNCVIAHLWHVVPGAHFQRMFGNDLNPHVYGLLETCADHIHWGGGHWTSSRGGQGAHNEAGGGHAHAGAMLYLGDNWPDRYRNGAFTCNIHGNRVNHDYMERRGSTYVAHHGKDVLFANDTWFRGLGIAYGPDGGVYVSDWTDTGECHNYVIADRTNGRIFKIVHGKPKHTTFDLTKQSDDELVKLQTHRNDWFVRHARRLLQERKAAGKLQAQTVPALQKLLKEETEPTRKLRALWALHAVEALDEEQKLALLESPLEHIRAWTLQLSFEDRKGSAKLYRKLTEIAQRDSSPFVRLYAASTLQRLPLDQRWEAATGLVAHVEDANDPYLPLMIWYAVEPLPPSDLQRSLSLLSKARIPLVREYLARRIALLDEAKSVDRPAKGLESLVVMLSEIDDPNFHRDVLRGIKDALAGRRTVPMPEKWASAYKVLSGSPSLEVRERAAQQALQFGDKSALLGLRKLAEDASASGAARQRALQALIERQPEDLVGFLQGLLNDALLRPQAIRGLAAYNEQSTPDKLLSIYSSLNEDERKDAVHTLTSRPTFALAMLDAMEKGRVDKQDLSPFSVRQLLGFNNKEVTERVNKVWGSLRPASKEKAGLMVKFKEQLPADVMKKADRSKGRAIYSKNCAACHKLFDDGGAIGPELTGSQRQNLDYVLENLLDPSAVVAGEYQVTFFHMKNGRVISGIVKTETDRVVTVQTQNEVIAIPKNELEERNKTTTSMMPEGLLDKLTIEEVRDLIAYLASPNQVPSAK